MRSSVGLEAHPEHYAKPGSNVRLWHLTDIDADVGRLPALAESLGLYREISTMDHKAPLRLPPNQKPTWKQAIALAREWDLKQLAARLEESEN